MAPAGGRGRNFAGSVRGLGRGLVVGHLPQGFLRRAVCPDRSGLRQEPRFLCLRAAPARGLARLVHADPVPDRGGDRNYLLGAWGAGFPRITSAYRRGRGRAFLRVVGGLLRAARDELLAGALRTTAA